MMEERDGSLIKLSSISHIHVEMGLKHGGTCRTGCLRGWMPETS